MGKDFIAVIAHKFTNLPQAMDYAPWTEPCQETTSVPDVENTTAKDLVSTQANRLTR